MEDLRYNNHCQSFDFTIFEEVSKSFQELLVWQKSHALVIEIYLISKNFPKDELYGLTNQLRRAAVSIPSNIAEGYGRYSIAEKVRFFNIAQGSLNEVKYYLILAKDLNYADKEMASEKAEEISKILDAYIKKMKEKII